MSARKSMKLNATPVRNCDLGTVQSVTRSVPEATLMNGLYQANCLVRVVSSDPLWIDGLACCLLQDTAYTALSLLLKMRKLRLRHWSNVIFIATILIGAFKTVIMRYARHEVCVSLARMPVGVLSRLFCFYCCFKNLNKFRSLSTHSFSLPLS